MVTISFIGFPLQSGRPLYQLPYATEREDIMADFTYICRNLKGTAPGKGQESGIGSCAKTQETGEHCIADSAEAAAEGKRLCPAADYLKILSIRKRK